MQRLKTIQNRVCLLLFLVVQHGTHLARQAIARERSRLAFYSNGLVGWVQEIVVHPDHRRRGIGKLLMNDFERWVALQGG